MSDITIRAARSSDARALEDLAALDSRRAPTGHVLVAEVDGDLVAAHSASGTIADPFRRTADVVELLRVRDAALHAPQRASRRLPHPRLRLA